MKSYSVKELALAYFPDKAPKFATTQLRTWIVNDPNLVEALAAAGHSKGQKVLTPMQVSIMVKALGEPDVWERERVEREQRVKSENQKRETRY